MLAQAILKLKFEFISAVAREPALTPLYWPSIWWQQYKTWRNKGGHLAECYVNRNTEFVLDGFQGTANSYATSAFQASQDRSVLMAHHMHAPAQIIKAVRWSIPTLVTIRQPAESVLSLTSRWPYVSARQALRSYIGFYQKIEPYRDGFVLSPFNQTTQHLDRAIQRVNNQFGTNFDVRDESLQKMTDNHASEEDERKALKSKKADELYSTRCTHLLEEANILYERMESSI